MTRETKVGLLMVMLLVGVFGFMVYKKIHRPSEALAGQPVEGNPADRATGGKDSTASPFETASAQGGPVGRRVVPAAAAEPGALIDNPAAVSASPREVDPFDVTSKPVLKTNDIPVQPVAQVKPNLPTSVSSDDAFADAFSQPATAAARPAATAASSEPAANFDPFERDARPATAAATTVIESDRSPSAAASDPFEAPLEVAQPVSRSATADVTVDERPAVEVDPFDAAPQFTASNAREPAAQVGDPFTQDRTPVLEAPVSEPASRSTTGFDVIEEPAQPVPATTTPLTAPPAMKAPAFESPPSTSPIASESTPARTVTADDDRLGGFRPTEVSQRAMNEFTREERTATTAIPVSDPFGEARRPAPTGRVDEDFAPRAISKPLVPGDTYNIEPNDNFWTISRKKYGTGRYFMALSQHNLKVIPDPKRMKPGVTIATPPAAELERTYSTLIPAAAPAEPVLAGSVQPARSTLSTTATKDEVPGFFVSADGVPMYRVGQEDTLSVISQRHLGRSSRWVQVFEMNREILTDGNSLKLGTVLRLPSDASRVEVVAMPRLNR